MAVEGKLLVLLIFLQVKLKGENLTTACARKVNFSFTILIAYGPFQPTFGRPPNMHRSENQRKIIRGYGENLNCSKCIPYNTRYLFNQRMSGI